MALTISDITLKNFRNYSDFSLSELGALTIFVGPNAIGKTNIIEAIQLTTALSSIKNASVEQLIKWGTTYAYIETFICDDTRELKTKLELSNEKKSYYVNSKKKQAKEIKGILPSVSFIPDDLIFIKGSQSIKRKTLDILGSQISLNYRTIKKDYEKILQHKNALLKETSGFSRDLIESVDEMLITTGVQFYLYRKSLLSKLIPFIQKHYKIISQNKEEASIRYIPSWHDFAGDTDMPNKEALLSYFQEALRHASSDEEHRHRALIGPHADRIEFSINGKDAVVYGSQGQQRSLVLSFKLAEVEVIQQITGQKPVLLLDDVMSELDRERRESLLDFIQDDIQTFITTTHLDYFPQHILNQARIIDLSLRTNKAQV